MVVCGYLFLEQDILGRRGPGSSTSSTGFRGVGGQDLTPVPSSTPPPRKHRCWIPGREEGQVRGKAAGTQPSSTGWDSLC